MTAHELAKQLLDGPDYVVVGNEVGQGAEEYEDSNLSHVSINHEARQVLLHF